MKRLTRIALVPTIPLLVLVIAFSPLVAQDESVSSTSPVIRFEDRTEIEDAWSTLHRSENGVSMTLHTNELTPGDAVTIWWAIFNAPENCSDGVCGEDDVFVLDEGEMVIGEAGPEFNMEGIEAARIAVVGATGTVVDDGGEAHFAASLGTGTAMNAVFGPGLLNPMGAEIWLLVRTHGQADPDVLDEQLLAINGGCDPEWPHEPCAEPQIVIHQPPE